jgi:hypothetical protein
MVDAKAHPSRHWVPGWFRRYRKFWRRSSMEASPFSSWSRSTMQASTRPSAIRAPRHGCFATRSEPIRSPSRPAARGTRCQDCSRNVSDDFANGKLEARRRGSRRQANARMVEAGGDHERLPVSRLVFRYSARVGWLRERQRERFPDSRSWRRGERRERRCAAGWNRRRRCSAAGRLGGRHAGRREWNGARRKRRRWQCRERRPGTGRLSSGWVGWNGERLVCVRVASLRARRAVVSSQYAGGPRRANAAHVPAVSGQLPSHRLLLCLRPSASVSVRARKQLHLLRRRRRNHRRVQRRLRVRLPAAFATRSAHDFAFFRL